MNALVALLLVAPLLQERTSESGLKYTVNPAKPAARKSPVMIFLHGTGGNRGVFDGWAAEARKRGLIVVLPSSTGVGDAKAGNTGGDTLKRWADEDVPKVVGLAREIQRTMNGDPKRTYLGGYSNGAFYAMETGLRNPGVFSAVLCIGGGCNVGSLPDESKRLGAYIIHGTADNSVPFSAGERASEQLKKHGCDVVFRRFENRGHDLFDEEAKAFFDWLPKFVRPYAPGSIAWATELAQSRMLVWFYAPKDEKSELADYFETDVLRAPEMEELAKSFSCVKLDRDSDAAKPFAVKKPTLAIVEADGKIVKRFETPMDPRALVAAIKKVK